MITRLQQNTLIFALLLLTLAGCGGGGSTAGNAVATPSTTTTLDGVASKGLLKGGLIKIYSLPANGDIEQKRLILPAFTADRNNATFSVNIGTNVGIILMEASGEYVDEATGHTLQILPTAPLRGAIVMSASGGRVPVAITPLTEVAIKAALTQGGIVGKTLNDPAVVNDANRLVSDIFGFDIHSDQPVEPLNTVMNAATQKQRDQTLTLAAISSLNGTRTLEEIIEGYRSELTSTRKLTQATVTNLNSALTAFLSDTTHNVTGVTSIPASMDKLGYHTTNLILNTSGQFAAGTVIRGIQLTLNLPEGITVDADSSGIPAAGIITATGVAAGSYLEPARYDATAKTLTLALINSNGFGGGEFASINLQTSPSYTPATGNFTISNQKVVTQGGVDITDITSIYPSLPQ